MIVTYKKTSDPTIPAVVCRNGASTPVWLQQCWEEGEFALYIRRNGCGHCCSTMVANLYGISITPYEEYVLCRKLWGAPVDPQDHFQTATGIQTVLQHLQIPAQAYGVKAGGGKEAAAHIMEMLRQDKMVIICSEPSDRLPNNPFSTGLHWVLLAGFHEDGSVFVANSSKKATDLGVQKTDEATIAAAIYQDCDPAGMTWGDVNRFYEGIGYIVVG